MAIERFLTVSGTTIRTRSEFTYDGLGRRVRIVERDGVGRLVTVAAKVHCTKALNGNGSAAKSTPSVLE